MNVPRRGSLLLHRHRHRHRHLARSLCASDALRLTGVIGLPVSLALTERRRRTRVERERGREREAGRRGSEGRPQGEGGRAAAPMAAIAKLPSLLPGSLSQGSSSITGGGERVGEANSCAFRQLRARGCCTGGAIISWARNGSLVASSSSSSFSISLLSSSRCGAWRCSGVASWGKSRFLARDRTLLFMIHRLVCACNGDRQRQQTVCYALDKGSENAAYQVRMSGFSKPLKEFVGSCRFWCGSAWNFMDR